MRIAIDYDKTITAKPEAFTALIGKLKAAGHDVKIVTFRHTTEELNQFIADGKVEDYWTNDDLTTYATAVDIEVIYTSGIQKAHKLTELKWIPDLWIDDNPQTIMSFADIVKQFTKCKETGEIKHSYLRMQASNKFFTNKPVIAPLSEVLENSTEMVGE